MRFLYSLYFGYFTILIFLVNQPNPCVEESDNNVTKLKCTANTETNKIKMLKESGSYTDTVRVRMLTQSEST